MSELAHFPELKRMGSHPRAPPPPWVGWAHLPAYDLSLSPLHLAHSVPGAGDPPPAEALHSFTQERTPPLPPGQHLQGPVLEGQALPHLPGQA